MVALKSWTRSQRISTTWTSCPINLRLPLIALPGHGAAPGLGRPGEMTTALKIERLTLPSECDIEMPEARLSHFCREEYDYYDGIPSSAPDRIEPVDVLATVAMNSRVNNAPAVRAVHRGLARNCDSLLGRIPE